MMHKRQVDLENVPFGSTLPPLVLNSYMRWYDPGATSAIFGTTPQRS